MFPVSMNAYGYKSVDPALWHRDGLTLSYSFLR